MKVKKMNFESKKLDDFFSIVSKGVILVPVVIIVLALIFKFGSSGQNPEKKFLSLSPTLMLSTPSSTKSINFDFDGPYQCHYQKGKQKIDIYIKNDVILAMLDEKPIIKKYFYKDGCLGIYDKDNKLLSDKRCGLGTYFSLAKNMISSGISGFESIAGQYLKGEYDFKAILDTCKKKDFDEKIFDSLQGK